MAIEILRGKGLAGEGESKNHKLFEFPASVSPVLLSNWPDPYLETERDDWALNPHFPWNSLPCCTQLCSLRVHEVRTAVLGDPRVLGVCALVATSHNTADSELKMSVLAPHKLVSLTIKGCFM